MYILYKVLGTILLSESILALDLSKSQLHNVNNDFLRIESGKPEQSQLLDKNEYQSQFPSLPTASTAATTVQSGKPDYVASNKQQSTGGRDYMAQFPGLPSTPSTSTVNSNPASPSRGQQSSGKRDYVAPNIQHNSGDRKYNSQFPSLLTTPNVPTTKQGQQNSGKRDYVAPQTPKIPSVATTGQTTSTPTPKHATDKRDYVAPKLPQQSTQHSTGKIKDLINFYDNQGKQQTTSPRTFSYSSIVKGPGQNDPKPFSQPPATPKPNRSSMAPAQKPYVLPSSVQTTKRPNGAQKPSLPSTILNNNKNKNNPNLVTDNEIEILTEELFRKDTNNAAKFININYQGKTTSHSKEDQAPQPLITASNDVWNIPTIQKLVPLLDNYERDTLVNEYVTPQEKNEENAFMDAIMATSVIRHLMTFLRDKNIVTPDPKQQRDFLKQLWFSLYSRGKGKISSSAFEHIFVSELKNSEVSGLHNWIYFSKEEDARRLNYLGYLKYTTLGDKGAVVKIHFNQDNTDKPVNTLFIGTSPELEIALYTTCFLTRPDTDCNIKLAGKNINIVTHTFRYRSKNLIGSAYPQFT